MVLPRYLRILPVEGITCYVFVRVKRLRMFRLEGPVPKTTNEDGGMSSLSCRETFSEETCCR